MVVQRAHRKPQPLIPGLPDDVAAQCLLRLPYASRCSLRAVSRRWRDLLSSPLLPRLRRAAGLAEDLVFLTHAGKPALTLYNATADTWHPVPVALPLFSQCVAVAALSKLVLLGGWDPRTLDPVPDVLVVDLVTGRSTRGRPMRTPRSFFACAAIGAIVYVAGGHDAQKNALRSAEAYDAAADTWRELPGMGEERDECRGVEWGGRFWVVGGYGTERQGRFGGGGEWFDEDRGRWVPAEGVGGWAVEAGRMWAVEAGEVRELEAGGRWRARGAAPSGVRWGSCAAGMGGGRVVMAGTDGRRRQRCWVVEVGGGRLRWTELAAAPAFFSASAPFSASSICL